MRKNILIMSAAVIVIVLIGLVYQNRSSCFGQVGGGSPVDNNSQIVLAAAPTTNDPAQQTASDSTNELYFCEGVSITENNLIFTSDTGAKIVVPFVKGIYVDISPNRHCLGFYRDAQNYSVYSNKGTLLNNYVIPINLPDFQGEEKIASGMILNNNGGLITVASNVFATPKTEQIFILDPSGSRMELETDSYIVGTPGQSVIVTDDNEILYLQGNYKKVIISLFSEKGVLLGKREIASRYYPPDPGTVFISPTPGALYSKNRIVFFTITYLVHGESEMYYYLLNSQLELLCSGFVPEAGMAARVDIWSNYLVIGCRKTITVINLQEKEKANEFHVTNPVEWMKITGDGEIELIDRNEIEMKWNFEIFSMEGRALFSKTINIPHSFDIFRWGVIRKDNVLIFPQTREVVTLYE